MCLAFRFRTNLDVLLCRSGRDDYVLPKAVIALSKMWRRAKNGTFQASFSLSSLSFVLFFFARPTN